MEERRGHETRPRRTDVNNVRLQNCSMMRLIPSQTLRLESQEKRSKVGGE